MGNRHALEEADMSIQRDAKQARAEEKKLGAYGRREI